MSGPGNGTVRSRTVHASTVPLSGDPIKGQPGELTREDVGSTDEARWVPERELVELDRVIVVVIGPGVGQPARS